MTENLLVISGEVAKAPRHRKSPAGIDHSQFYLVHNSTQVEAGFNRHANCYLGVVAAGAQLHKQALRLNQGMQIRVRGFIASQKTATGIPKLVLHANDIEII